MKTPSHVNIAIYPICKVEELLRSQRVTVPFAQKLSWQFSWRKIQKRWALYTTERPNDLDYYTGDILFHYLQCDSFLSAVAHGGGLYRVTTIAVKDEYVKFHIHHGEILSFSEEERKHIEFFQKKIICFMMHL